MPEPSASPLAAALDSVGDRWSLLVVEALLDGPRRFGDLQADLPGIAPNVLSGRLRRLESEGVIVAERAWLQGELERLGFAVQPSVTNFLFADFGPDADWIHRELLRRGIIVRPMSAPGIRTRARISIPTRPGGERLVRALEEIAG